MEIIDNILHNLDFKKNNLFLPSNADKYAFFDIETTGLSKKRDKVYLTGFVYYADNCFHSCQFLAESDSDEYTLLSHTIDFASQFSLLVSFNGDAFDIPFVKERCRHHDIKCNLPGDYDIYKEIKPLRKIFGLSSLRQKSVEDFLGIKRIDEMNGGELIDVYKKYTENHDSGLRQLLLQHNFDDICGLADILPIISYRKVFSSKISNYCYEISDYTDYVGNQSKELTISFTLPFAVPVAHTMHNDRIFLHIDENSATLRLSLYVGTLRHFFDNYKDYYYLPLEDRAIHKSVGIYVDSESKEKCKKENCCVKKTGIFAPLFGEKIDLPLFSADYKAKENYFEITNGEIAEDLLNTYVQILLDILNGR